MFYIDIGNFNDIDVVTFNKIFDMLNEVQKNKVVKNKRKIMSYYLLEKYYQRNKPKIIDFCNEEAFDFDRLPERFYHWQLGS